MPSNISKYIDIIHLSVLYVLRRKKRNFGIFLSVGFGVGCMIFLVTMGQDVKKTLNQDLELLGGATVMRVYYERGLTAEDRLYAPLELDEDVAEAIRAIPGVAAVSQIKFGVGHTTWNEQEISNYMLVGTDHYYWQVSTVETIRGHFFGNEEVEGRERVCVLGATLAQQIFGSLDVVGMHVPIHGSMYKVVGILGGGSAGPRMEYAYIPVTTIEDRVTQIEPPRVYVRSASWDDVEGVAAAIPEAVASVQSADGLEVEVAWGPLKQVKRIVFWVLLFIYFSVGSTLIVGGFGIWSSMMNSVKMRTREIGLKKAMGATDFDILLQILSEALSLTVMACLTGIVLGRGAIELLCHLLQTRPDEHVFLMVSAGCLVFTVFLGFVAGYYPALKASRMEVVSAIRYE